jgi:hypothetical protein
MRDLIRLVESDQPISDEMSVRDFLLQHCTLDDGVLRFKSNNWVPHSDILDMAVRAGLAVDIAKCDAARAVDKQDYAASKDRIKRLTGSSIDQLRDFMNDKGDANTKIH